MAKGNSGPTLLEKVFGKDKVTCPMCGGAEFVTKLKTVDVDGQKVDVFSCIDPRFQGPIDPYKKGRRSCLITSFGVMPDGSKVVGLDERAEVHWSDPLTGLDRAKRIMPDAEQMVAGAVASVRARFVRPTISRRFCHTRECVNFCTETSKPFCGRCGSETLGKGPGILFPNGLRSAVCKSEGCRVKGKRIDVPKLDQFCRECGKDLGPDMDKTADVVAALGGVR